VIIVASCSRADRFCRGRCCIGEHGADAVQ
jgi:hypothetical protein